MGTLLKYSIVSFIIVTIDIVTFARADDLDSDRIQSVGEFLTSILFCVDFPFIVCNYYVCYVENVITSILGIKFSLISFPPSIFEIYLFKIIQDITTCVIISVFVYGVSCLCFKKKKGTATPSNTAY